jgi:hypothetical protein
MNRAQRILLYLYSTPNIVGSILGIVGLLLFFTGLIQDFWLLIVVGLYLIGVFVTPNDPTFDLTFQNQVSVDEIRTELEKLVGSARKRIPKEALEKVESIKTSILSILPQIVDINAGDRNLFIIRQTALDYLPETLEYYMNLPPAYANLHPIRNGKTARQLLLEQLDLLDNEMQAIVADFHRNDSQKILAHSRFLEQKFRRDDLLAVGQ